MPLVAVSNYQNLIDFKIRLREHSIKAFAKSIYSGNVAEPVVAKLPAR